MRTLLALISALLAQVTVVYATALTYRLEAHEKACFFAHVENKGTKLAFYFAVGLSFMQRQSWGHISLANWDNNERSGC